MKINIIPNDHTICVDGQSISFDFDASEIVHLDNIYIEGDEARVETLEGEVTFENVHQYSDYIDLYYDKIQREKEEAGSDLTKEEVLAKQIIAQCKTLLAQSDWTQLPDVSAHKGDEWLTNWSDYRQALRIIINQAERGELDVHNGEWPVAPDTAQPQNHPFERILNIGANNGIANAF